MLTPPSSTSAIYDFSSHAHYVEQARHSLLFSRGYGYWQCFCDLLVLRGRRRWGWRYLRLFRCCGYCAISPPLRLSPIYIDDARASPSPCRPPCLTDEVLIRALADADARIGAIRPSLSDAMTLADERRYATSFGFFMCAATARQQAFAERFAAERAHCHAWLFFIARATLFPSRLSPRRSSYRDICARIDARQMMLTFNFAVYMMRAFSILCRWSRGVLLFYHAEHFAAASARFKYIFGLQMFLPGACEFSAARLRPQRRRGRLCGAEALISRSLMPLLDMMMIAVISR